MSRCLPAALWILAAVLALPALGQDLAIVGGRVVPVSGAAIDGATVLVRDGRIVEVGVGVEVPAGIETIDAAGKWVTPGLLHLGTRLGLVEISSVTGSTDSTLAENDVSASFSVFEGINPASELIAAARSGGVTTVLIERNTTIPTRKSEVFTTAADNQPSVEVHVLQGEREMAKDNRTLGRFHLEGLPAAPRGVPQVEVAFDIDANGILNVTAKDLGTNKEQKITVTSSSGLSDSEIDQMVQDADSHASEDKTRREQIEARNQLDGLVYQTDKMLNDNRENLNAESISAVETAVADARKVLEQEEATGEELNAATEALQHASHQLAETMYQQQAASPEDTEAEAGAASEEEGEVIEAEVVEDEVVEDASDAS